MIEGNVTVGPASLCIGRSDQLPEHMRDAIREISSVYVHPDKRRAGHGSDLVGKVCSDADIDNMTLILTVRGDGSVTNEQLVKWYETFGFVKIQEEPILMARQPQKLIIQLLH